MKRILLVEDNATVRRMLAGALADKYEVVTADNGLMGWIRATSPPFPDLIIADVEMPKLNGIAMVKRLKAAGAADIPVVFLTSHDRPVEAIHGLSTGARYYLTKPFHVDDVLAKVHSILKT